jgi:hypothetical protein
VILKFRVAALQQLELLKLLEGQLITNEIHHKSLLENGKIVSDVKNDILENGGCQSLSKYQTCSRIHQKLWVKKKELLPVLWRTIVIT